MADKVSASGGKFNDIPCTLRIKSRYPSLRNSEKKAADHILNHPETVIKLTLQDVSAIAGISEASVLRFCRKLGYQGFSDFKLKLALEEGERGAAGPARLYKVQVSRDDRLCDIPKKVVASTVNALEDTLRVFDLDEYKRALHALEKTACIDFYAIANSAVVADDALNKWIKLGKRCHVFTDPHLQIMSALSLKEGDVAVGISHSGRTKETVDALKAAHKAGAVTICITNHEASEITEAADIKLLTSGYETEFFSETMVSRISQLAIIDMLYMGLILLDYDSAVQKIRNLNEALAEKAY
ncbi:MAG: MurR/RpiR family transcriptional regulator [Bacillota bacterium]